MCQILEAQGCTDVSTISDPDASPQFEQYEEPDKYCKRSAGCLVPIVSWGSELSVLHSCRNRMQCAVDDTCNKANNLGLVEYKAGI